jgi:L-gulonolactone oxidase
MQTRAQTRAQTPPAWRSWSGLTVVRPAQVLAPATTAEVVDAVLTARAQGLRVKMVGSGHSFSDIAATDGVLLLPHRLTGVVAVDRDTMTVTALAGTPLHALNERLEGLGLALHNMGDIDRQTVAGAVSTGTHGTGGRVSSLSAQVAGLELVTADGEVVRARPDGDPREARVFAAARVGLGALGVLTSVTFRVEPAFALVAVETPMPWSTVVDGFEELASANDHFEAYWFPHTDRMLTKRNNRTSEPPRPLSRVRAYVEDELLENTAFGLSNRLGDRFPRQIPRLNRLSSHALSPRTYSDVSHRVLASSRRVLFREMEHALPREVGMKALSEVRSLIERRGWHVGFPLEIRHAPADDCWLSPAHERDTVWLACHVNGRTDHREYFSAVEEVLASYGGRPHWGKLHTRSGPDLAPAYPRFEEFVALRDELDPGRLFGNDYLQRVLTR